MIKRTDLRKERDRIAQLLTTQIKSNIGKVARLYGDCLPSPHVLDAMNVESVYLSAADAVLILDIFDRLDRVHLQAETETENCLRALGRIGLAEYAYRNPRIKKSSDKAVAAVRALNINAKDEDRDNYLYEAYVRFSPFESRDAKIAAITLIAERETVKNRKNGEITIAAVIQAIKRGMRKRRDNGLPVLEKLPRVNGI